MTAIAGFCDSGNVWIGGDSAGVSGFVLTVVAGSKVFRNRDFLFGFTSSFRMGQLLQHSFTPPAQKEGTDVVAFMVSDFVNALRECLKAGGYARKNDEAESAGTFLLGYRGRLFQIESDYQVSEAADGYDACGCAREVVLGALFSTKGMEPRVRLENALAAAEAHSAAVRGPFVIEVLS